MKNVLLFALILSLATTSAIAQNCNCAGSFDWMVTTFKNNDAGFQYIIDKKGLEEYTRITNLLREKAGQIHTENECLTLLNEWLNFFRKGHIGAYLNPEFWQNGGASGPLSEQSKDSIRSSYKNEETVDFTPDRFKEWLNRNAGHLHPIEGIWTNNTYTVGIVRSKEKENQFVAFIIRADSVYWMPGQKKAVFDLKPDSTFSLVFNMRDHSRKNDVARLIGRSGSLLQIMNAMWTKVYPESYLNPDEENYIRFKTSNFPFLTRLSDKTLYIRIPSFDYSKKPEIDTLLAAQDSLIRATPNLIIDIRYGTGGSDLSFYKLMPYIYTQPIRQVNYRFLASELNAKGYDDWANAITDTAISTYCRKVAKKMRENPGSFITLEDASVSMDSSYTRSVLPERVAIICNYFNGSTDEAFLLKARESMKVKIFGTPTSGALDISNVHVVPFPNGRFLLTYGMTASLALPALSIDGVGIQPDFFLDDTMPEEDWVQYVKSTLEY